MNHKLNALLILTELAFNSEKSKLKSITHENGIALEKIRALTNAAHERSLALAGNNRDDFALSSGADFIWFRWCEQEKAKLNIERAAILARLDQQKQETRIAFGKNEAARKIYAADIKAQPNNC